MIITGKWTYYKRNKIIWFVKASLIPSFELPQISHQNVVFTQISMNLAAILTGRVLNFSETKNPFSDDVQLIHISPWDVKETIKDLIAASFLPKFYYLRDCGAIQHKLNEGIVVS